MQINVDIVGMKEIVGKLNKFNQIMAVRVEAQVRKSANKIRKSGKAKVPILTGTLQKSIKAKYSKDKLSAVIGPQGKGAWRAHFIEFGTVKMAAKPFMSPAYEENKTGYLDGMKAALKKSADEV